jgi:hypothetical protein
MKRMLMKVTLVFAFLVSFLCQAASAPNSNPFHQRRQPKYNFLEPASGDSLQPLAHEKDSLLAQAAAQDLALLLNSWRVQNGLTPLKVSPLLCKVAKLRLLSMSRTNEFEKWLNKSNDDSIRSPAARLQLLCPEANSFRLNQGVELLSRKLENASQVFEMLKSIPFALGYMNQSMWSLMGVCKVGCYFEVILASTNCKEHSERLAMSDAHPQAEKEANNLMRDFDLGQSLYPSLNGVANSNQEAFDDGIQGSRGSRYRLRQHRAGDTQGC